jgi:hypothetical protein
LSKKIMFLIAPLVIAISTVNISYAACAGAEFLAQAQQDSTLSNILSGGSNGKPCPITTPDQIVAIVGNCPNDMQANCSSLAAGLQKDQCQKLYMGAYYGKVQIACNYLANVQASDQSYQAPPPIPRPSP